MSKQTYGPRYVRDGYIYFGLKMIYGLKINKRDIHTLLLAFDRALETFFHSLVDI